MKPADPSIAPVALMIFNRPDFTARSFAAIAEARPAKLFVIADGPRTRAEEELCLAARSATEMVDWECEVVRIYAGANLGCRERVVSGLNQVFAACPEALIFEDDMMPDPSAFRFGSELLARYHGDRSVFSVGGFSMPPYYGRSVSYSFSRYALTWGWGTWARAWNQYSSDLRGWPERKRDRWLDSLLGDRHAVDFYTKVFDAAYAAEKPGRFEIPGWGPVQEWDFTWHYSSWIHGGVAVVPSVTLVANSGFRSDSTNVTGADHHLARLEKEGLEFPLRHPDRVDVDRALDAQLFQNWFRWRKLTPWQKLRFRVATHPAVAAIRSRTRGSR